MDEEQIQAYTSLPLAQAAASTKYWGRYLLAEAIQHSHNHEGVAEHTQ